MIPRRCRTREARAFTLVEVLLAVMMLGLLMGALLTGLHTGTGAWRKTDAHLIRTGKARTALDLLLAELRDLVVPMGKEHEKTKMLIASVDSEGRPTLKFWTGFGIYGEGLPGSLRQVEWKVVGSGSEAKWQHVCKTYIGGRSVGNPETRVILEQIGTIRIRFLSAVGWTTSWDDTDELPLLVEVYVRLRGAPSTNEAGSAKIFAQAPR